MQIVINDKWKIVTSLIQLKFNKKARYITEDALDNYLLAQLV